jgi:flagellar hook-associated protein 1 FlgK
MGLDSALLTASSGLRLVSRQMAQASQNVANASTPGYSVKTIPGEAVENGGVRALDPRRDVDEALRAEARLAQGQSSAAALADDVLGPLSQLQGSPADGTSIGDMVGALRDTFVALRTSPSDPGLQGKGLSTAQELAGRLNEMSGAVGRARQSVQDGLHGDVDQANALLRQIATLDGKVRSSQGSGQGMADLLDQRDAAVSQLSDYLDVTPVPARDGGVTLILRGGSVLPLDPDGSPLSIGTAQVSPQDYWGPPSGTLPGLMLGKVDITASLKGGGGRIAAGLELRDDALPLLQSELDLTAATVARRLDDQGLRLFTDGPTATGAAPPDPSGYAGAVIGFAGRIAVSRDVAANPALLRDGTHAVAGTGFTPNPAGGPSGFTTLLDAVLDTSFGASGTPIPTTGLGPAGNLSSGFASPPRIADYAAAATANQGMRAAAASDRAAQADSTRTRVDALVQKREGVDVDQEMASLVQLQNAYAANARVMAAVQTMWDALLGAVR